MSRCGARRWARSWATQLWNSSWDLICRGNGEGEEYLKGGAAFQEQEVGALIPKQARVPSLCKAPLQAGGIQHPKYLSPQLYVSSDILCDDNFLLVKLRERA
jgi:hypothetical protein